ncbi:MULTISPECIES: hypothetical protein [Pseudomonas]|uniref:hypothetical protein n=1 Tax=Pseudomonas sp. MIL9 TaxID=2807620 RepID=UPI00167AC434|nr:hypothetical protein [Pseudomonas sp. MIL9]MBM6446222.1 hypothetical protein [Pseudomonas sp. MIL9]
MQLQASRNCSPQRRPGHVPGISYSQASDWGFDNLATALPRKKYHPAGNVFVEHFPAWPGSFGIAHVTTATSVALSHSINANIVHKWIRLQSQTNVAKPPAFIPLTLQSSASRSDITPATICLEIPHPRGTVKVNWPAENADACVTFVRDLLR